MKLWLESPRLNRRRERQVMLSTHSREILSDEGIGAEEVLLLEPTEDGTRVHIAADDSEIRTLLEAGVPLAEVVVPRTSPRDARQLMLFDS